MPDKVKHPVPGLRSVIFRWRADELTALPRADAILVAAYSAGGRVTRSRTQLRKYHLDGASPHQITAAGCITHAIVRHND
jgi:hypothetical protein